MTRKIAELFSDRISRSVESRVQLSKRWQEKCKEKGIDGRIYAINKFVKMVTKVVTDSVLCKIIVNFSSETH